TAVRFASRCPRLGFFPPTATTSSRAHGRRGRTRIETSNKESVMQLGLIGLGRMGANMVRRLVRAGHQCVVYNRSPGPVKELAAEGAIGATSIEDFVKK